MSARAEGYGAKSAQVLLDDQPLGTLTFLKNQIRIAKTETTTLPADPGLHTITMRFSARGKDAERGGAAVDPLTELAFYAAECVLIRGAEPHALEPPAGEPDQERRRHADAHDAQEEAHVQ